MTEPPFSTQRRFWLVTNGAATNQGWSTRLRDALAASGVQLEVLSLPLMLAETARGIVESGAEAFARAVRLRGSSYEGDAGDLYSRHRPELVIVDHPEAVRWLELLRSATRSDSLHVGLISSWEPASGWTGARVDAMIACDELQLVSLAKSGLPEHAYGLASPMISHEMVNVVAGNRGAAGFADAGPMAMLDLSATSAAVVQDVFAGLSGRTLPLLVAYSGSGNETAEACRRWAGHYEMEANLFGAPFEPSTYSIICDLVVVTPGVRDLAGYLCQGRPVVSLNATMDPIRPARDGAVVGAADGRSLGQILEFLQTRGVADSHASAAGAYAGADGLGDVVRYLLDFGARRIDLLSASRAAMRAATGPSPSGHVAPTQASPFEKIGTSSSPVSVVGDPQQAHRPLPRDEAREQLAALIMQERKVEAELDKAAAERDRWMTRVELAAADPDASLREAAQQQLDQWVAKVANLGAQAASIESQKEIVRRRAASVNVASRTVETTPDAVRGLEDKFRALERQRELDELKGTAGSDNRE
jgi:hypothetical protein